MPTSLLVSKGFLRSFAAARPIVSRRFATQSRVAAARFAKPDWKKFAKNGVEGATILSVGLTANTLYNEWEERSVHGRLIKKTDSERAAGVFCLAVEAVAAGMSPLGKITAGKAALLGVGKVGVGVISAFGTNSGSATRAQWSSDLPEQVGSVLVTGLGAITHFATVSDVLTMGITAAQAAPRFMGAIAPILDEFPNGVNMVLLEDFDSPDHLHSLML